jgi:hypothetical protein
LRKLGNEAKKYSGIYETAGGRKEVLKFESSKVLKFFLECGAALSFYSGKKSSSISHPGPSAQSVTPSPGQSVKIFNSQEQELETDKADKGS